MSRAALLALALLLASLPLVAGRQAPRDPRDPDRGTGLIQGRVAVSDTGLPLRRAQIRASARGVPLARFASTDAEGRFELRDLAAGRWTLTASRAGYVTQRLGQPPPTVGMVTSLGGGMAALDERSAVGARLIDIGPGTRFTGADFALVRGGAINGRVFDEVSEPVAGAQVTVLRSQFDRGRRLLVSTGTAGQTDDRGAFRVFGLPPGEYYVSATLRASPLESADLLPDASGTLRPDVITYAPTYFPGTTNVAEAQPLALGVGQEADVTISLLPSRLAVVSGTVIASNGLPLGNGRVTLAAVSEPGAPELTGGSAGTVLPDGSFVLANVVPGSYLLEVRAGTGRANAEPEVASVPITVGGADMTGLTISTGPGTTITGTVAADRAGARLPAGIEISGESMRGPGMPTMSAQVSTPGTFRLSAMMGPWTVRVTGLPDGWSVKSIELDGTDVTDRSVDFMGNQQIAARVVLTDRVTELAGTVTARGEPVSQFGVVVFPEDASKPLTNG
ncbi:MAG: carboxypeptidase regulatory-like domain-containing protein [Acidobacteria bacterium]|nr:carboxypeptidase regulatory-like domain-containing protein [Acidobacteriota bacterium]